MSIIGQYATTSVAAQHLATRPADSDPHRRDMTQQNYANPPQLDDSTIAVAPRTKWSFGDGLRRRVPVLRLIAAVLLALAVPTLPGIGSLRTTAVVTISLPLVLVNAALLDRALHRRSFQQLAAVADIVFAFTLTLFLPDATPVIMMTIIALAPLYVLWLGWRPAVTIDLLAIAVLTGSGLMTTPTAWVPQVVGFASVLLIVTRATSILVDTIDSRSAVVATVTDGLGVVVWESDTYDLQRRFIGGPIEEVLGLPTTGLGEVGFFESRIHPDDREVFCGMGESADPINNMGTAPLTGAGTAPDLPGSTRQTGVDYRIIDEDDSVRYLHEEIMTICGADGGSLLRGTITDETEKLASQVSSHLLDDLVTRMPAAMVVLGAATTVDSEMPVDGSARCSGDLVVDPAADRYGIDDRPRTGPLRILAANPAAIDVFGDHPSPLVGRPIEDLLGKDSDLVERLGEMFTSGIDIDGRTLQLPGTETIYSARAVLLPHRHIGLMLDDITRIARTAELLRRQATHDHLTGLPNRAQFNDRLETAIRSCNSASDPTTVAVLMIDLNKFKEVNDTYGHEYGDKVLVEVARRLTRNVRGCDTISRLGGDEFAVIVRSSDAERSAHDIAQRIEQLILQPFQILEHTLSIGVSIGIAIRSQNLLSARTLVRDADHAMYRAKALGGGIVNHDGAPTTRGTAISKR